MSGQGDYGSDTRYLRGQTVGPASKRTAWMMKNMDYVKAFAKFSKAKLILGRANLEFAKLDYNHPLYVRRLEEFNTVALECSKARWYSSVAIVTREKADWKKALKAFDGCIKHGQRLLRLLEEESEEQLGVTGPLLSDNGTEIEYADDAPVVPQVCPVVILQGSSYEMGYQYPGQLVQIFGPWILEKKAGRKFSEEAKREIGKWEEQIRIFAPEILEMCEGWAQGATDAGIEMSYTDVLEIWTGHMPPKTTYMGRGDKISDVPPLIACSGAGAWGRATEDGRLVTGSSGDHDPSFPVVIMAYPDTGNNFIFTTFSAIGDIVLVGSQHMFGFPGMNNKGLAYIEHGGQPRSIEPKQYWGYGLRRATSVFHILRFANSAKEAMRMELEAPVGDAGMDNGTVGGFYADSSYGYVLESRKEPVAFRETGYMGETDFLYANNSAMHRDAMKAEWMRKDQEKQKDWTYDEHAGWYPKNVSGFKLSTLFNGGDDQALTALRGMYHGCRKRNLYHYEVLSRGIGHINMEYMKMIFRNCDRLPDAPWKVAKREYDRTGRWIDSSVGHAGNGIITVTKPDNGDEGLYAVCTGEAKRGAAPNSPFLASFCPMYNEANAFWEIKLSRTPEGAAQHACLKAKEALADSRMLLSENVNITNAATLSYLKELILKAEVQMKYGEELLAEEGSINGWARAARECLRAQVNALKVCNMLKTPPMKLEEFDV